jgi:hypothetical protein
VHFKNNPVMYNKVFCDKYTLKIFSNTCIETSKFYLLIVCIIFRIFFYEKKSFININTDTYIYRTSALKYTQQYSLDRVKHMYEYNYKGKI